MPISPDLANTAFGVSMEFFDFAADLDRYQGSARGIDRLNRHHEFLVAPFVDEIRGSRVLNLAAHDGP